MKTVRHSRRDFFKTAAVAGGGMKEGAKNQFDHIVLVTVRRGVPSVALVKLDGFVPKDLVVESQVLEEMRKIKAR